MYMLNGDQNAAMKLISEKINANLNDEIFNHTIKFLQTDASTLTAEGLTAIGKLFLSFRTTEPIRKFWNLFFDILLEKTSPQDVVQFYSEAMRENSNVPYNHIFQVTISLNEFVLVEDSLHFLRIVIHCQRRTESIARHRRYCHTSTWTQQCFARSGFCLDRSGQDCTSREDISNTMAKSKKRTNQSA